MRDTNTLKKKKAKKQKTGLGLFISILPTIAQRSTSLYFASS